MFCSANPIYNTLHMTEQQNGFIETLYSVFNSRDVDGIFKLLRTDVMWAEGMEGGHARGLDKVRA